MAQLKLSDKLKDGKKVWDVYALKNPNWKKLRVSLASGLESPLFERRANTLRSGPIHLTQKHVFKLVDNKSHKFNRKIYAHVQVLRLGKTGYIPINKLAKPPEVDTTRHEKKAREALDRMIKDIGVPINVVIKKRGSIFFVGKDIIGAREVPKTPKADFALYDIRKKNVIYISHKAGKTANSFQKYSGITDKAGRPISQHKETIDYVEILFANTTENTLDFPIASKLRDRKLKNLALYGPDWTTAKRFGEDHVQQFGQGDPILKATKKDRTYELHWSAHEATSGDLQAVTGKGYDPVFGVKNETGKVTMRDKRVIRGTRSGIYPLAFMKKTAGTEFT
jgi:hypothetical protein